MNGSARAALEEAGVAVWTCDVSEGTLELPGVLRRAASEGLISILSEGGATIATSLLAEGLVDQVAFFIAPKLYGSGGVPALTKLDRSWGDAASRLRDGHWTVVGGDCLFQAKVSGPAHDADEED